MTNILTIISIITTRLIFIGHGTVSVFTLLHHDQNHHDDQNTQQPQYFLLLLPLSFLLLETLLTLYNRNITTCRYFWPCGFFYITTIIPIVWVIELQLLHERITERIDGKNSTSVMSSNIAMDDDINVDGYVLPFHFAKLDKRDLVSKSIRAYLCQ